MIQSFAYEKLILRELKNANRDKKVYIVVELSNQKRFQSNNSTKIIRKHTMLANSGQKLKNSEFLLFLLADTLRESIFA